MTNKLTARSVERLARTKGRYLDDAGLFLRVMEPGRKVYWTLRYRLNGVDREMSLGSYPAVSLADARFKQMEMRALVAKGADPVGERRKNGKNGKAPVLTPSGAPTFGHCADQFIGLHEGGWKNSKHHQQWVATLKTYAAPIREMPVDRVTTADVLAVLTPIWNEKPETASRLRGRIEAVLASAQVDGWIPEDRPNPAQVEELARPQVAQAEKARLARPPQGAGLHSVASPYGEARGDRQRSVAGVAHHHPDLRPDQRGARHDLR